MLTKVPKQGGNVRGTAGALLRDSLAGDSILGNYISYYNLCLAWRNGRFSKTDSVQLAALAALCPQLHGKAVLQARVLLHRISGHYRPYPDDCNLTGRSKSENPLPDMKRSRTANIEQQYHLAPNPNDGRLQLLQAVVDVQPVRISVFSAIGALVFQETHSFESGIAGLDLSTLSAGMYYVNLQDNTGNVYTLRFLKQ